MFYLKGADTVMQSIVQYNDWLNEEVRCASIIKELFLRLIFCFFKYF
jgi:hypothetical protein